MLSNPVTWMEHRQVPLFIGAIVLGAVVGLTVPEAHRLEAAINPVLALLLFATFLGVRFASIGRAFRDIRFLAAIGVLNFVVIPLVVFGLSRFVAHSDALLIGVLLVLLTPCVDYVIVFAGLAGGSSDRLLAAAPLLMLAQLLLLPAYLLLFGGPGLVSSVDPAPFIEAFVVLILIPLLAAVAVQLASRRFRAAVLVESVMHAAMVPLLMATLAVVIASQLRGIGEQLGTLVAVVPIFIAFVLVAVPLGIGAGRIARLDVAGARALTFSGTTRNSLVVLPLALALPAPLALAPLVVVTQTLVELVAMVVLVRVLPTLIRRRTDPVR